MVPSSTMVRGAATGGGGEVGGTTHAPYVEFGCIYSVN